MKTQIIRLIALLMFASVAISSCSIEYRERHNHHSDNDRRDDRHDDRDHGHDHDHDDNH